MNLLMYVGFAIAFVGGLWLLYKAFCQSLLWGIACIFLPFMALFFVLFHWHEAKKPFLTNVAGLVIAILAAHFSG
jgi:hypothetical protein